MGKLAITCGHSLLAPDLTSTVFPARARRRPAHGPAGAVTALDAGEYLVLPRHGLDQYVPPHRVDHARNLGALQAAGCDRVLAISSVGSLRADLPVGAVVVPDDFIALDQPPVTVHGDARDHVTAEFTADWRARVLDAWTRASASNSTGSIVDGGVYWQTSGPRFETRAEIRLLAQHADVVGMTVASECTAANQLGLAYAAVCVVDNLANGIGKGDVAEEFAAGKEQNQERLIATLEVVAPELATGVS